MAFTVRKDENIGEIIARQPDLAMVLMDVGMGCIYCPASQMETLEEACMVHGIDSDALVEYINNEYNPSVEDQASEEKEETVENTGAQESAKAPQA